MNNFWSNGTWCSNPSHIQLTTAALRACALRYLVAICKDRLPRLHLRGARRPSCRPGELKGERRAPPAGSQLVGTSCASIGPIYAGRRARGVLATAPATTQIYPVSPRSHGSVCLCWGAWVREWVRPARQPARRWQLHFASVETEPAAEVVLWAALSTAIHRGGALRQKSSG